MSHSESTAEEINQRQYLFWKNDSANNHYLAPPTRNLNDFSLRHFGENGVLKSFVSHSSVIIFRKEANLNREIYIFDRRLIFYFSNRQRVIFEKSKHVYHKMGHLHECTIDYEIPCNGMKNQILKMCMYAFYYCLVCA